MKELTYNRITIKAWAALLFVVSFIPLRAFCSTPFTIVGQTPGCVNSNTLLEFEVSTKNQVLPSDLTFTWYQNGVPVTSAENTGDPQVLLISSYSNGDVITCQGVDVSNGLYVSNTLTITLQQPQAFGVNLGVSGSVGPNGFEYCPGQSVTFTADPSASASSFIWTMNGATQSATGSTFTTTAQSVAQLQSVEVTANPASGQCVIMQPATAYATMRFFIDPITYPSVTLTQSATPVLDNSPVTFTATPSQQGSLPIYLWVLNGNTVAGVTGPTFTTSITSGSDVQSLSVSMTSSGTCPQNAAVASTSFEVLPSDWENQNYIRVQDILVPGISNFFAIDQLPIGQKRERTTYLDGLGRPIQKLDRSGSLVGGTATDLVVPVSYDQAGRSVQQFLPYTTTDNPGYLKSANVTSEQSTFVTSKFGEPSSAPTYSQTTFDNSPLNRVMAVYGPGASWGGSNIGITYTYDFNNISEDIRIWTLAYTTGALPATTAYYNTGTLYKNTTTDENGKLTIVYVDLSGDTILKKVQQADPPALSGQDAGWACTYYVYDDRNQLRFILTPKLIDYLDANGYTLSQQLVNDLAFVYTYDGKGRQISKKTPGIGEVDVVYDQRDRPVFMQDALGQSNNQWQSITYDALDRQTSTGMMLAGIATASLQTDVNGSTGNITINEDAGVQANLVVSGTQSGNNQYTAANKIIFEAPFHSTGTFTATINPSLAPMVSEAVVIADNPVPGGNTNTLLTQTFYDDYSQGTKTYTTPSTSLFGPSVTAQALPMPSQYEPQTRGHVTVSKVKVITNNVDLTQGNWLETDNFYDNQGRILQTQNDNGLGGLDIVTNRYDWAGKLWGNCVDHMAGSPTQFTVVADNTYDNLGRLTELSKNFNSSPSFKELATYSYDEYGTLTTKVLAPGYTGSGQTSIETLNYSYNIQGWLTGINKAYALDQNIYDQWNDYFGLYLGYDNSDKQFNTNRYDGSITGAIWKSQGDNSMRRYDYSYDDMGRLTAGTFLQRASPADNWSNSQVDLSETITYADKNGNIQTMQRNGVVPGMTGGVPIDNLTYSYGSAADPNSNQLSEVVESASFAGNGQLDDFKNGTNPPAMGDYQYDVNGNLIHDNNKGITAIAYNYLNKPYSVTIPGKATITYTYDATGVKLSKTVVDQTVTPNVTTTTSYDDEFVYQNNALQYVLHEEGRLNIITPVNTTQQQLNAGTSGVNLSSGQQGVFEYFIKDQLSNVRLVLTEENQTEIYACTMETSSVADPNLGTDEAKLFGEVDPSTGAPTADNEVNLTRKATNQTPWTGNPSANVSDLTAALGSPNQTIGPNLLLKVSAGDVINAGVQYFYFQNGPTAPSYNGGDVVTALLGALAGSHISPLAEGNSSAINNSLNNSGSDFSSFINSYVNNSGSTAPKAFLNVIFFDEQFNFIPPDQNAPTVGTALSQVSSANDQSASPLALGQKAPKNGWVYIYVSNESNEDVYFDNLSVSQVHGRISEENHYYAFGQQIAGICNISFNKLATSYRYQGDYSEQEPNTQWNEFDLRMYDPQLGRWTGADPYDQFASPYVGMGNDPVNNVDPDGGDINAGDGLWGTPLSWGLVGAVAGAAVEFFGSKEHATGAQGATAAAIGFAAGFGAYYVNWGTVFNAVGASGKWTWTQIDKLVDDDGWLPFYKSDLIMYAGTADNNLLGRAFENIFEMTYRSENPVTTVQLNFHRNEEMWDDSGNGRSKPDFTANAVFFMYHFAGPTETFDIPDGDAWEVKQNNGRGIYLSSNDWQIERHLMNLARRQAQWIAMGYRPGFSLVTTYDVKYSHSIESLSNHLNIEYDQVRVKYKIVHGQYRFKLAYESFWHKILRKILN